MLYVVLYYKDILDKIWNLERFFKHFQSLPVAPLLVEDQHVRPADDCPNFPPVFLCLMLVQIVYKITSLKNEKNKVIFLGIVNLIL